MRSILLLVTGSKQDRYSLKIARFIWLYLISMIVIPSEFSIPSHVVNTTDFMLYRIHLMEFRSIFSILCFSFDIITYDWRHRSKGTILISFLYNLFSVKSRASNSYCCFPARSTVIAKIVIIIYSFVAHYWQWFFR